MVLSYVFLWGEIMGNVHTFSFHISIFLCPTRCLNVEKSLNFTRKKQAT
jgi:hypothetical protein